MEVGMAPRFIPETHRRADRDQVQLASSRLQRAGAPDSGSACTSSPADGKQRTRAADAEYRAGTPNAQDRARAADAEDRTGAADRQQRDHAEKASQAEQAVRAERAAKA